MNDKTIRISSDAVSDGSRSDWQRVRNLSDAQVDAAIADDQDWLAFEEDDFKDASAKRYAYQSFKDAAGRWTWRLVADDGNIIAVGPDEFASKKAVTDAIRGLRAAFVNGQLAA